MTDAKQQAYFTLLTRWNERIRLTGSTQQADLTQHAAEALSLIPHLPEHGRVVDIGSGGGFPGVILAIARPSLVFTLVEPLAKKAAFLNACRRELELSNVDVVRARDSELHDSEDFVPFDVATSQATFAPSEWFERGLALVRLGGVVLGMLGPSADSLPAAVVLHDTPIGDRELRVGVLRRPGSGS